MTAATRRGAAAALPALLHRRRFRQLLAVRLTSQASDGVFQVALTSYVLFSPQNEPTAARIAAGLAALLMPFSVLGPFVGVFLDRWRRRQVLVVANLLRLAPVALLAVLVADGRSGPTLFGLVLVALSINRFLLAGLSAALPHVVEPADLVLANSVTPTAGTLAFMAGVGLAAAARAVLPMPSPDATLLVVSGIGYLVAAALALRIPIGLLGPDLDPDRPQVRTALASVVRGLTAGLRHLRSRPAPAAALGVVAAHRFLFGLATVATILLYRNVFYDSSHTGAALSGLALVVLLSGAGFFTAAVLTPPATSRTSPQRWIVALLAVAAVVEIVPTALFTKPAVLVAAFFLGLSAQGVKICVDTLVQTGVDDAFRGRVFAIYDVVFNAAFVAAAAVGAVVVPRTGRSYALLGGLSLGYVAVAVGYAVLSAPRRPAAVESPPRPHQSSSAARAAAAPIGPLSSRRSSRKR